MKKTYNISLNGRMFHCEEDAGDALQRYIETLEKHYTEEEGGNEIMDDIESRIAELLDECMRTSLREVVILSDIEKIIATMGCPNDIFNESGETGERKEARETTSTFGKERKFYRDVDNGVIGGVSAGIAAYFSVPVLAIRLLFLIPVLLSYGFFFLFYIALWVVTPAARTSKEKMEMKGEKMNISNIERNIRNGVNEVRKNGVFQRSAQWLEEVLVFLINALGRVGKVLLGFIAFICLATSIFGLLLFTGIGTFIELIPDWSNAPFMMSGVYGVLSRIAMGLIIIMPLLMLAWLSIKYLFKVKSKTLFAPLAMVGLWILGIVLAIFIGIHWALNFATEHEESTITELQTPTDSCFVITTNRKYSGAFRYKIMGNVYITEKSCSSPLLGLPKVQFEESEDNQAKLVVIKKARGRVEQDAVENTSSIHFKWEQKGDTISIDNYFSIENPSQWRDNEVELILQLPEGFKVKTEPILRHRVVGRYSSEYRRKATCFVMEDGDLEEIR